MRSLLSPAAVFTLLAACQGEQVGTNTSDAAATESALADAAATESALADGTSSEASSDAVVTTGECAGYLVGTTKMSKLDGYCIDRTEVTKAQWKQFVKDPSALRTNSPAFCDWDKYEPPIDPNPGLDEFPVDDVDFCNASAYCKWAGKRLCGKIGGGNNALGSFADAAKSQWYRACSNGGVDKFPYGAAYLADKCADGAIDSARIQSFPECHGTGPYADIFDLSGNASEWEESCATPSPSASTLCRTRGGGTRDGAKTACDTDHQAEAGAHWVGLGFRCCKDL